MVVVLRKQLPVSGMTYANIGSLCLLRKDKQVKADRGRKTVLQLWKKSFS